MCRCRNSRSPSAVPTVGDLRARRHRTGALDIGRLGRRREPHADAAGGRGEAPRARDRKAARRRHADSGAGAGQRLPEDGAAADLRLRRLPGGRQRGAGHVVRLLGGPEGRSSAAASEGLSRHFLQAKAYAVDSRRSRKGRLSIVERLVPFRFEVQRWHPCRCPEIVRPRRLSGNCCLAGCGITFAGAFRHDNPNSKRLLPQQPTLLIQPDVSVSNHLLFPEFAHEQARRMLLRPA